MAMAMQASDSQEYHLSSGNILSKSISWRKGNEDPDEEIYESLRSCIEIVKELPAQNGSIHELFGEDIKNNNEENVDRQELKVSLKLFLYTLQDQDLLTAVNQGLAHARVDYLDTLVVTFSGRSEGSPLSLEEIQTTWKTLEEMVKNGKIKVIGLSDVDTQLFIQLHDWAQIKPGIIQINLASCCVVPPELAEFCKQQGIQLLTHSDPINALSEDKLQKLLESFTSRNPNIDPANKVQIDLKWVLRHQVHLKCRGVLASKGYSASLIIH